MRILLLHNPAAGTGDHRKDDLIASLRQWGSEVSYCCTRGDDFPMCLSGEFEALVIAGGDGTVIRCVRKLPDRRIPIGIVPLGGANNIATSLGFTRTTPVAKWAKDGGTRSFHAGVVRGLGKQRTFLEGVGIGALPESFRADAGVGGSIAEKILGGRQRLAGAIARLDAIEGNVVVDGNTLAGRWLLVEALLLSQSGPRLSFVDESKGREGRFSVAFLDEERRDDMLEWLINPDKLDPPFYIRVGSHIAFQIDRKLSYRVDDKRRTPEGGRVEIAIEEQPFRLLTSVPVGGEQ